MIVKILVLIFLLNGFLEAQHNIYINEFLASNVTTSADLYDYDDFSDWIELYNDSDTAVDLGGYFITDKLSDLFRWSVPQGTIIKAKSYLCFWADGYNDVPGNIYQRDYYPNVSFTTKYYHLNFKLSRAGEWLGLVSPDSLLIDSVSYSLQYPDISYGRKQDNKEWYFFAEPTPGHINNKPVISIFEESESPQIYPESGFYDVPLLINISVTAANAVITYTLDGSKPKLSSTVYSGPFEINETSVLRVCVFEEDKIPSKVITNSYFINENIALPVISLSVDPQFLWDEQNGIYQFTLKDREVPVNFAMFDSTGNPLFYTDAGLSLTGQASVLYPQKSFTISAKDRFGTDAFYYQFFTGRKQNYFKDLYLRNSGVPDHRNTMFRDGLQATIIENKMDLDYQAYQPFVVFINGDYWGIYNLRDKINAEQLALTNNINPDDIDLLEYEISPVPVEMDGNADNYNTFYNYVKNADLTDEDQYRKVADWMDIDEYINYQICEIYFDNVNAVDQNVRMWRERKDNRKWRWIMFDMDYGFGMPNVRSVGYQNNTLRFATSSNSPPSYVPPLWSTMIFRKLLQNNNFRNLFIQRFAGYMNTIFKPDTLLKIIDSLQNRIYPEMNRHILRWKNGGVLFGDYPIQSMGDWLANVNRMKDFARYRSIYQQNHIIDYFDLNGMQQLSLTVPDNNGYIYINKVIKTNSVHNGFYFKNIPVTLKAVPEVGYKFIKWHGVEDSLNSEITLIPQNEILNIKAVFENDDINLIPHVINSDLSLLTDNSPYYANDNIIINAYTKLTIEKGVEILMPAGKSIVVNGSLKISGLKNSPVIIRPNAFSESWGALCFVNTSDSSDINYLKIEGATKGIDFKRDKAAVSSFHSDLILNHVEIENVQNPVFIQYGNVKINDCILSTKSAGDLINVKNAESVIIENCDLQGNDSFDSDAIDFDHLNNGIIRGNQIYNFYGYNSDGIDLGEGAKDILIEGNIIYNINDKGVSIGGASTAVVKRNVLANCGQGAGIKDFESYGYFEQNTFYANEIGIASFVKNIGAGGGSADAVNCIFANSRSYAVFKDASSYLNVSYSLSNSQELTGLHNIFAEPLFLNNLFLSANSPAINSGDPTLPPDADGSLPDMGAYPYDPGYQDNLVINEIHYNPLEGSDFEFIEIFNKGSMPLNLHNYRIEGDVEKVFNDLSINAGSFLVVAKNSSLYNADSINVVQWDKGNLPDGAGNIILKNNEDNITDFVHYDAQYWWPKSANGMGPSLELLDPLFENMVSLNWRASYKNGGTPGRSNNSEIVSGLFINELLASNTSGIRDENDEYDDWIEIYNTSNMDINMAGLYLTDKKDNPLKYLIPNNSDLHTNIPSKGFLLFWADEQGSQGSNHLNFKLDKDGEWIGLVQVTESDTVFIDSVSFGKQTANISYGRIPDGSIHWRFFNPPSPLDSNHVINSIESPDIPAVFALEQNYPNPFNNSTTIKYQIPMNSDVLITIYNVLGQKVVTIVNSFQKAGTYKVEWNASAFTSGIYFYQLKTKRFNKIRKLLLLK